MICAKDARQITNKTIDKSLEYIVNDIKKVAELGEMRFEIKNEKLSSVQVCRLSNLGFRIQQKLDIVIIEW